jgi:hypothetical protein
VFHPLAGSFGEKGTLLVVRMDFLPSIKITVHFRIFIFPVSISFPATNFYG